MASFFPAFLLLPVLFFFNPKASEAATDSPFIASIDCGASKSYTDNLGITWSSDTSIVNSGQTQTITNGGSISQPMRTLRVFPTGKRNCYAIPVSGGGQVLVRASFLYGNYDGKSSPPMFDLEFEGNSWATVETSLDAVVTQEAIYAVSGGSMSVCVVQTKSGDLPFVSAIEVRGLDDSMYSHYNRRSSALVLALRRAVGLTATVRYPDDPYDRLWLPYQAPDTVDVVQNQATTIDTGIKDSPPAAIFQSAVTPATGSNGLSFTAPLPSTTVNAYMNMYFTEVMQLDVSENRTFQVLIDSKAVSDPLAASFGGVLEFYYVNSASSSTVIQLVPTADATLPPVLCAMEVYVVIPLANGGGSTPSGNNEGDSPTFSGNAPPTNDTLTNDAPPSNDSPTSDAPPQSSDQENSAPAAERVPAGSAFGGGRKANASFGHKVKPGWFVEIVGIVIYLFSSNFM